MYNPEYMRKLKLKRREAGLCPTCGGEREDLERINCRACSASGTRRKQESRRRLKMDAKT